MNKLLLLDLNTALLYPTPSQSDTNHLGGSSEQDPFFVFYMRRTMAWSRKTRFVSPIEVLENPEEWDYFTDLELMKSRGSSVCITCDHFTYTCDKSCVTLLTCPLHQRLIPQGEHLTKRCRNWQRKRVLDIGLCPEVA